MHEWFHLAFAWPVVRRALICVVIVGAVLITINHGDAIVRGEVTAGRLMQMALTLLVPYCVSTYSSVGAMRAQGRQQESDSEKPDRCVFNRDLQDTAGAAAQPAASAVSGGEAACRPPEHALPSGQSRKSRQRPDFRDWPSGRLNFQTSGEGYPGLRMHLKPQRRPHAGCIRARFRNTL